jgi:ATP-dependent RNA helicase MSS116, mitochondrial
VGLTEKEQYVHRLGRTARAGKGGSGMIIVHDFEEESMLQRTLRDMNLTRLVISNAVLLRCTEDANRAIALAMSHEDTRRDASQAYQAWLGFYNSHTKDCKWDKPTLVHMANQFATTMGFDEPPGLLAKTVGKMGLKGVPGLRIERVER